MYLIIGTGIYGCHAAMILKRLNIDFRIADITNDFFTGSSSKNQNRLHQGFHYSRSFSTRHECMNGFLKFKETYPMAVYDFPNNYYFIDKNSLIDYKTYKHIYTYEKIPFEEHHVPSIPFEYDHSKFDGPALLITESYVDFKALTEHFKQELSSSLIPDYDPELLQLDPIIKYKNQEYSHLIDCTYYQLDIPQSPPQDLIYELCISLLYKCKSPQLFAMTVMDGPFWSLYPYDPTNSIYTLTDVTYTPMIKTKYIKQIRNFQESLTDKKIINSKNIFETRIIKYIPKFKDIFEYHGFYTSLKTKPNTGSDDRSLLFTSPRPDIWRFCGGKLTGIFAMEDIMMNKFSSAS
jgi:hypothetical protein